MASVFSTIHLGDTGITVVDPGWVRKGLEKEYLRELDTFLRDRGRQLEEITQVVVTHAHPDHLAAASCLLEATRAQFIAGAVEWQSLKAARAGTVVDPYALHPEVIGAPVGVLDGVEERRGSGGIPDFVPQRTPNILLSDGDRLHARLEDRVRDEPQDQLGDEPREYVLPEELGLGSVEAVVTPGHTPGHLCLVSREKKILLAADMVLPEIHPGIGLGIGPDIGHTSGNPVVDYLLSLKRLEEFDDYLIIPGHGYVFTGLGERRRQTAQHVLARAREVSRVLEWNPEISIWRLASQLSWSSGWDGLRESSMLFSGLRQTMMYRDLVFSRERSVALQANTAPLSDRNNDALTQWEETFDLSN